MNFTSQIMRFLGFGPDADPEDPLYADSDSNSTTSEATPPAPAHDKRMTVKPVEFDPKVQDAIFARVVDVFNESLPPFLAESVNPEAQRRYLRNALDQGISDYLESLKKAAEVYCDDQWKSRQTDMAAELDAIRLRAEDVERRSNDIQQKQLSADRQKRALTERVHDLESQVASLASEREQLELENRSLLNRLKVANIHQEEVEKVNAELADARAEVLKLRENPEIISKEREDVLQAKINEMDSALEAMKDRLEISDKCREELQGKLKEAQNLLSESVEEIEARDKEIENLKETIAENIKRQNEREQLLRNEIEELRPAMTMSASHIDFSEEDEMPRISDEDLSAIEATFDADITLKDETFEDEAFEDEPANYDFSEPGKTEEIHEPTVSEQKTKKSEPMKSDQKPKGKSNPEQLSLF